jgi:hypothetical protein
MHLPARIAALLASRRLPPALAALAVLLVSPALRTGLVVDDYVIRAVETARTPGPGVIGPFDAFRFTDPSDVPRLMEAGVLPWWTSPGLRLAFLRPLSSASHWLDFQLFPGFPVAMHLVSLAWLAAMVVVAALLYRRLLGAGWVAGLAAVLFTLDPGHALSAGWVAARNAVLAGFFGLAAVYAHDRWRRDGERWASVAAPLLLAASLASGESGVATLALLVAHALAFDGPGARARARALAPHAAVAIAWVIVYRAHGSGTAHSAMYIDPLASPGDFVRAALLSAPINLGSRLGGAPASLALLFAERVLPLLAAVGLAFALLAALALAPLLRREPAARFFAVAAVLALLPIAGTIPNDRNLVFVGFAGLGLSALVVRRAVEARSWPLRIYAGYLLLLEIVVALPLVPANATTTMKLFARLSRDPLSRVLEDDAVRGQTAVFVNPPAQFFMSHLGAMRAGTGEPMPSKLRALVPGIYPARVVRVRGDQLAVHVEGGILPRTGTWPAGGGEAPVAKWEYMGQALGRFVRGPRDPMRAGEVIALEGFRVSVDAVAGDGGPSDMTFTFDRSLDDPSLRWLAWQGDGYVPFAVPPVGGAVELAPASLRPPRP